MRSMFSSFLLGVLCALVVGASVLWVFRTEVLNLVSNLYGQRVVGETKVLQHDATLYQDGNVVGTLKRGTRLIHRLQTESLEEFHLPIGWDERRGQTDAEFVRAKEERAFVVLKTE